MVSLSWLTLHAKILSLGSFHEHSRDSQRPERITVAVRHVLVVVGCYQRGYIACVCAHLQAMKPDEKTKGHKPKQVEQSKHYLTQQTSAVESKIVRFGKPIWSSFFKARIFVSNHSAPTL